MRVWKLLCRGEDSSRALDVTALSRKLSRFTFGQLVLWILHGHFCPSFALVPHSLQGVLRLDRSRKVSQADVALVGQCPTQVRGMRASSWPGQRELCGALSFRAQARRAGSWLLSRAWYIMIHDPKSGGPLWRLSMRETRRFSLPAVENGHHGPSS